MKIFFIKIRILADWPGGDIILEVNGERRATIKSGFEEFRYHLSLDEFNVENDLITLESTNNNGGCITSLHLNDTQIFVGRTNNLASFWIDGDDNLCMENLMSTSRMFIRNGKIIFSECKS